MAVIYQTFEIGEADIKAYVTQNPAEADIWVYIASSRGLAGNKGVWFVTKQKTKSQLKIYFSNRGISNVIVYFTNDIGSAGWRNEHKLMSRI